MSTPTPGPRPDPRPGPVPPVPESAEQAPPAEAPSVADGTSAANGTAARDDSVPTPTSPGGAPKPGPAQSADERVRAELEAQVEALEGRPVDDLPGTAEAGLALHDRLQERLRELGTS